MIFHHDLPENKGVENGIKRAKQMTDFRWTPVKPLPAVSKCDDMTGVEKYVNCRMRPWLPQKGLIYSSVLENQKFIGFNVSFEAFATALSDPDSVLYKCNVCDHGRKNANTWYGVVCSCFASYVFDMKERWICRLWPAVKNVSYLGNPDVNDLKLLDIVLNVRQHIAVVTDILRDEQDNVVEIEVSESTLPKSRATRFSPQEFIGYWYGRDFKIYRKSDTESIRYTPSPFVRIEADPERGIEGDPVMAPYVYNRDILPDQGNGTNYLEGQDIILDLLRDDWDGAEIAASDGSKTFIEANDRKVIIPLDSPFHAPGFYTAKATKKGDGTASEPVSFAVTGLRISPADGTACSTERDKPVTASPAQRITLNSEISCSDEPGFVYIFRVSNSGEMKRFKPEADQKNIITIECVRQVKSDAKGHPKG